MSGGLFLPYHPYQNPATISILLDLVFIHALLASRPLFEGFLHGLNVATSVFFSSLVLGRLLNGSNPHTVCSQFPAFLCIFGWWAAIPSYSLVLRDWEIWFSCSYTLSLGSFGSLPERVPHDRIFPLLTLGLDMPRGERWVVCGSTTWRVRDARWPQRIAL